MGYYVGVVALVLAAALQPSVLPAVRIFGGQPDFVLLMVLAWSVHAPLEESIFWAFVGGVALDSLSLAPLGTSAVALLLMVFAIHTLARRVYSFSLFFLLFFVALGTLVQHLMLYSVLTLTGYAPDFVSTAQYFTLPTLGYNLVLAVPVYWVLRRIQKRIPEPQRGF